MSRTSKTTKSSLHIGFVSTRFAGTDGVSLETRKWAEIFEEMGYDCFYFSGLSDRPESHSMVVPEAFYRHPEVDKRHKSFFGTATRTSDDTEWIHDMRQLLLGKLHLFVSEFDIDLLVAENCLTIPLNIPLGLALAELVSETGIPTIAHHHDFVWERKRFLVNNVRDYIHAAFPPDLPSIQHVVINSIAEEQLAHQCGISSEMVPNVMNFEEPAPELDEYCADVRETLGLGDDELFVLQPTRIIQRKGIEHAIELVSRLGLNARLVISHASGDEGDNYTKRVRNYSELLGVRVVFASEHVGEVRGSTKDGSKIYSLDDMYLTADLVTYPSVVEGFGNAFLEAVYFKTPTVVHNYSVYAVDIRTKGFEMIEFDDYVTDETIEKTRFFLKNKPAFEEVSERNFELAKKHFSYQTLRYKLGSLVANAFGAESLKIICSVPW